MMKCRKCRKEITPEAVNGPCPHCGSGDREIIISGTGRALEMTGIKATDTKGFMLFKTKQGEKLSKYGRVAREYLHIDRRNSKITTKTHIVEEQQENGEFKIVHEEYKEFPAKHR